MSKTTIFILSILWALLLSSCGNSLNEPTKAITLRQAFTNGYAVYYGSYYDYLGIDAHVFELDLYTEGLGIDSTGQYTGTGYNLYITDIFSLGKDTLLTDGIYSIDTLNNYTEGSIIGGESYGGIPGGAQLISVSATGISYDYIVDGKMEARTQNDTTILDFKMKTRQGNYIENQFKGILPQINLSKTENKKRQVFKTINI